ncbi:MAG: SRPBCC family protein [Acidimicrobiia bacterium]|nr:SRPBCC family protein [Acidimicrobiia bacterium]
MPKVRVSVVIDAPPKVVWRVVEDIAGHVDWMADAVAIRFITDQRSGVGTTFDCDTQIGPFRTVDRMEVTEWRPGRAMGVTHRGLVTGRGRFTLTRAGRGRTRFTWREALDFPLWFGGPVGALVAQPVFRRVWRRNLVRLKAQVEGG